MKQPYVSITLIFVFFASITTLFGQDGNPVQTISREGFGSKLVDTIYYEGEDGGKKIHKIVRHGFVTEFYISGNVKANGRVVKKNCVDIYDSTASKVLYKRCNFSLEGEWIVYYDTAIQIKAAIVLFKKNKEISKKLLAKNGCVYENERIDGNLVLVEKFDQNCVLFNKVVLFPFQGEEFILSSWVYDMGKVIQKSSVSSLTMFVAKYYDKIGYILLFLGATKFILCFFYFQNFYKDHLNLTGLARRYIVSFKGTFTVYIKIDINDEHFFMARVHNVVSILFFIVAIFFFYHLNVL